MRRLFGLLLVGGALLGLLGLLASTAPGQDKAPAKKVAPSDDNKGDGQKGDGQNGDGQNGNGQNGDGQNGNGENGDGQHGDGQHGNKGDDKAPGAPSSPPTSDAKKADTEKKIDALRKQIEELQKQLKK